MIPTTAINPPTAINGNSIALPTAIDKGNGSSIKYPADDAAKTAPAINIKIPIAKTENLMTYHHLFLKSASIKAFLNLNISYITPYQVLKSPELIRLEAQILLLLMLEKQFQ